MDIKMPMTTAVHNGPKVAQLHNARDPRVVSKEDHIDPNGYFEIWCHEMVQDAYDRIFGDSVEEYNGRQPDKRRQIDNYYQTINKSKQKNPCYEVIVTVGNKDHCPPEIVSRRIVQEYILDWKNRNPNFEIIGAYWHADEPGAPHAHITYIPVAYENKRGMQTQCSQSGALREMGFTNKNSKYSETEIIQWQNREREVLDSICREYSIEVHHPDAGKGKKHLEKDQYIVKQQIAELKTQQEDIQQENEHLRNMQLLLNHDKEASIQQLRKLKNEIAKINYSNWYIKDATDFYDAFIKASIEREFDPEFNKFKKIIEDKVKYENSLSQDQSYSSSHDSKTISDKKDQLSID